jgi:hypothetical protein
MVLLILYYTNINYMSVIGRSDKNYVNGDITVTGDGTIQESLNVDSGTLYVDDVNNRVGIVNTTPSYPLDVVGDINFTGTLYQNGTTYGGKNSYIRKKRSGATSVNNASITSLNFQTTVTDFSGSDMTITSGTRTTIDNAGLYLVVASTEWQSTGTGNRELWISHLNSGGGEIDRYGSLLTNMAGTSRSERQATSAIINCSATDRIEIRVYHD